MNQLIQSCRDRIREETASVRTLAKIIGKLTSSMQAVLPAPLHYRHLQMLQVKGLLAGKSYETMVSLNQNCLNDLQWWVDQISTWNGRSIITPAPDLVITTDASLQGWGAVCQGVRTRGLWSQQESNTLHINALELKAALFAVRAFTAKERQLHVHLRMDNRTAVAYVLKMGGTRSSVLVGIAQELWGYALTKQITLTAEYLPGKYNHEADWESRHFRDSSNWKLNPSIFQARPTLGAPRDRPVCRPSQCSTDELCQLVSRPICPGNRCLSDSLVETERLQLSTFLNDLPLSGKDQERPGNNSYDNTNLAYTSMVPSSTRNVLQTASSAPPSREHPYVSQSTATPPCSTRKLTTSGLDGFRQNILAKGVSEQTAELLSSHSWRKGTTRAYNSAWSQWCGWCHQREIDPFCSTVASIADYLTEMFNKGRCYRTINNHRSAISAFHKPIEGCKAGQHELVCKVLNACFNARPPQPRYVVMWDVDRVLDHICTLGCDANLSDKQVTLKLSMLLALASAGRSSDLRALDLRYMTVKESCIVFELGRLTKSRKKGQCPLKLTFTAFDTNPDLCAVSTINCYLERTKGWRSDCNKNQLVLGYIKPHKEVVPSTIAGWLVQMMKESGVDTSEFRAHSTRGASTSKAKAKGLSCQEIMNMAKWKKESTFRRHYLRDIVSEGTGQDAFQATVLQEG